jgi:hypothetical protein
MITEGPLTGNEEHDADYYDWLRPYFKNRGVTDEQLKRALADDFTVEDILLMLVGSDVVPGCLRSCNPEHDADYYVWLGPYLRTGDVTDEQLTLALASGLSVRECHHRLLDAECLLFEAYDYVSCAQGWQDAVIAIEWLDSDENRRDEETELFYGHLRELADDRRQGLRQACFATALITGTPEVDAIAYSNTLGRVDCLAAGMLFARNEGNDYSEIASVLRSTFDMKELRELAARQQAIEISQMLYPIWTPYGYVRHDQIGSI